MTRKQWCEFSKEERMIIYDRDFCSCIYCGGSFYLGVAHVFISRAHGGKGCKENGVLLCSQHHQILDQGANTEERIKIRNRCEKYLRTIYGDINVEDFKYEKWNQF